MESHLSKEAYWLLFSHDHSAVNFCINGLHSCEFYSAVAANDDKYGFTGQDRIDAGVTNADLALEFFNPGAWIRVIDVQV